MPDGATLTITYQVLVDDPLAGGITDITNTATVTTDQSGSVNDSVIDPVVRPEISVEPNSADTAPFNGSSQTITFDHIVTNTGDTTDSYALTVASQNGWVIELIDPASPMVVIATDSNGDGIWDGGATPNTGSLAAGTSANFLIRVTIPAATAIGTLDTVNLIASLRQLCKCCRHCHR